MNTKLTFCIITLFIAITINTLAYSLNNPSITQFSDNYQTISETITALHITRTKYQELLLIQQSYPAHKDKTIIKEYSIFIDYLSFQINNYCTILIKKYGDKSVEYLACNKSYLEDNNNYQTVEEKVESLDDEFISSLGEFDEMLLIEDEKIAQISHNKSNQRSVNADKKKYLNKEITANRKINKETGKENNSTKDKQKTTSQNTSSKGKSKQSENKSYKRKRLDEIDDDIVARQLKEAAEKETNQELKEKLWDEYYKYKQTIGHKDGTE